MTKAAIYRPALLAALWVGIGGVAAAQTGPTPQQLQSEIDAGQEQTALSQLRTALQAHPNSGVAWYLVAEAEDASGNETAARGALAKAEQVAPGLPFAQPDKVAALQAHLAAPAASNAPAAPARTGTSPLFLLIGAVVVLFFLARMFLRSRRMRSGYPANFNPGAQAGPGSYGPGGMPYGPNMGGGMGGGGLGGSLMSGLAAGAGLAAGERVIDGMMGGGGGGARAAEPGQDNTQVPDRDDGLSGTPGWGGDAAGPGGDTISSGGDFDPGNNW